MPPASARARRNAGEIEPRRARIISAGPRGRPWLAWHTAWQNVGGAPRRPPIPRFRSGVCSLFTFDMLYGRRWPAASARRLRGRSGLAGRGRK